MKIKKLIIKNYKIFDDIKINMNENMNIFIGQNNSGKTTILEAIQLVLTAKLNGYNIMQRLTCDWFNKTCRDEYIKNIDNNNQEVLPPPQIIIEAYFFNKEDNEYIVKSSKGTNNTLKEDSLGIGLTIKLDEEEYLDIYNEYIKENKITDIPIELYKVEWKTFSSSEIKLYKISNKVGIIDTTKKDIYFNTNKLVPNGICNLLDDKSNKKIELEYKNWKDDFNKKIINDIPINNHLENKQIQLNLKEENIGKWKDGISLKIDDIPYEYNGIGNQNMIKSELFIEQNNDINILLVEEPENNLTYTNMYKLINRLIDKNDKQIFISTHSSFVSSKLGLKNLLLLSSNNHNKIETFKNLNEVTNDFFMKLPNYNVLRIILSNHIVLVEGPCDDLIIQRAYHDENKKYPIDDGIDIMSINGIAFKRYCELAQLINKHVIVVSDNDKKPDKKKKDFKEFKNVKLFMNDNENENTLEPSLVNANIANEDFKTFKEIIYTDKKQEHIEKSNKEDVLNFMKDYKTQCSWNIFKNTKKIKYPKYINDLIKYLGEIINSK